MKIRNLLMKSKITKKEVSENIHTYGKVKWVGGSGKQFVFPYKWNGNGFEFLFFAYGKKTDVVNKITSIINETSDEKIRDLNFVQSNKKIPLMLKGGIGLNCF